MLSAAESTHLLFSSPTYVDSEMPVLNGPGSTKMLREQGCSCYIIGVTGNVMQADVDFFKSCGVDAVFAKPLSTKLVEQLLARISTPRKEGRSDIGSNRGRIGRSEKNTHVRGAGGVDRSGSSSRETSSPRNTLLASSLAQLSARSSAQAEQSQCVGRVGDVRGVGMGLP
jgi:CheY-like chemotaxis protein